MSKLTTVASTYRSLDGIAVMLFFGSSLEQQHSIRSAAMASRSLYAEWSHPMGARPFGPKLADPMPVRVALPLAGASMPAKMELPHTSGVTPLSPQQPPETLPPLQWVANGLSKYNWDDANMDEAILKTECDSIQLSA